MKIVFIVPYFGILPNYFDLFLNSCAYNPNYDWLIISDIEYSNGLPPNVSFLNLTWEETQALFQSKFDFKIQLKRPYKLCDFRPAYGYVFQNYVKDYDYWGYCDVDLILGNLSNFLPENKIKEYDKIGHLGHLSLYRNTDDVNKLFMSEIDGILRYKEVFSSERSCVFDEWNRISINHIFLKEKKSVWMFDDFFDIYPYDDNFKKVERKLPVYNESYGKDIIEKDISFGIIKDGKTYQLKNHNGKWEKKEVAYIHFQKRKMLVKVDKLESGVFCALDTFIPLSDISNIKRYLRISKLHRIFNKKRMSILKKRIFYWIIVKTSRIRHPLRKEYPNS